MRICLISREYPPETHIGGIASYTHKTAAALVRLGHEVHVVTAAWKPGANYEENGVQVHRLAEPRLKPREAQSLLHAKQVAGTIARIPGRLDVVQACEWGGEAFWYALAPARRAPLVTRLATPLFLVQRLDQHSSFGLRNMPVRVMERVQTRRSDGIISPTRALADIVCQDWKIASQRVTVVPTGMDPALVNAHADGPLPEALRGSDYILYFGRLEERKGVQTLGAALPRVLDTYPGLKAVFVGDDMPYRGGTMREAILAMNTPYAERLLFLPRMPQPALFPIIKAARLVALPSLWENLANTCLEAMQLGRPVIGTRGCGFEEVIEDGLSGFLVEPGDAAALAGRMLDALADPVLLEQVGASALRRMEAFSIDKMAARLADYYAQIVARWRRAPGAMAPGGLRPEREQDSVEVAQ
ncbi:MAG TPA: glycosyltransferase family 4 protein [Ktedonobacterales bacterium]|jgi:glycosyltransferase involved in cell wall biosynthesis